MADYTKKGLFYLIVGLSLVIISDLISMFYYRKIQTTIIPFFSFWIFILIIIGLIYMLLGRKEFSERHQKFIVIAFMLYILTIILTIIIYAIFVSISSLNLDIIRSLIYISPILAVLTGIFYLFLLFELEDKIGKIVLYIAFISSIVISIYIAISSNSAFDKLLSLEYTVDNFISEINFIGGLGIISNALYIIALLNPYYRLSTN